MQAAIIHQYHFEEDSGATTTDAVGGTNGTVYGTTRVAGVSGYAMHSSSYSNMVVFTGPIINAGNAKTIDFWYRASSGATPSIINQGNWNVHVYSNQFRVDYLTASLGTSYVWSTAGVNDGNWHRLTFIYDLTVAPYLRVYIDGVFSNSSYGYDGGARSGDMTATAYLKGGASAYDIDELTIYDSVAVPTYNPTPILNSISPSSAGVGGSSFTLTASGSNFIDTSVIRFDGSDLATNFSNSSTLTATISAAQIASAGNHSITVYSPFPGGGSSAAKTLSVVYPLPVITGTNPSYSYYGTGSFWLDINGTGFVPSSTVTWNDSNRAVTYHSSSLIGAQLLASDLQSIGNNSIKVINPTPGGGTSTAYTFQVRYYAPSIGSISPSSLAVQSGDSAITLTGAGYTTSTVVRWNGSDLATSYTDSNHVSAAVPAALLSQVAIASVTAYNPAPGGGSSTAKSVSVTYKTPTITSLSQNEITAGGAGFQLGLAGTNFTTSTAVYWDGSPRTIVFQSANGVGMLVTASDIAAGGTHSITAGNPSPAGISAPSSFDVLNPAPAIDSLSSTSTFAGSPDLALVLVGSGFVPSSTVAWAGVSVDTVYQNGNQLTATIPASHLSLGGTFAVTVSNPSPGGGTSGSVSFDVLNPSPTLSAIDPIQAETGTGTIQVLMTGTGFVPSSVGRWDGSALATAYVNPTAIQVTVPSSLTASGGTHAIDVSNPAPGGGISAAQTFVVYDYVATTTGITPDHADVGMPGFVLTVNGTGFNASSIVRWNGADLVTNYINDGQLSADVSAGDIADGGLVPVAVYNPGPGGGLSNAQTFTVYNLNPTISAVLPSSANQGSADILLTLTGTGFSSSTVMRWNGNDRSTIVASSTSLSATITAADLSTAGNASVTVFNPAPGGGTSGAAVFFVNARPAQPTNVSPTSGAYGVPVDATLQASAFSDPDFGDIHASSVWEVTSVIGDYSAPIFATTTFGSDVTLTVPAGILSRDSSYGWHVRYVDQSGAVSPFSAETIFYTPTSPSQPVNLAPANSALGVSSTPTLSSTAFTDPDPGHTHASSYWELTATPGDYSSPVMAVTSTVDLTSIAVSGPLDEGVTYAWHVRYVGSDGDYSQFSSETVFTTLTTSNQPAQNTSGGSAPPSIQPPTVLGGSYVSSTVIRWAFRNFSPFATSFVLTNDAGAQVAATSTGLIGADLYVDEAVSSSLGVCGRLLTAIGLFGNSTAAAFPCSEPYGRPIVAGSALPLKVVSSTEETIVFHWTSSTSEFAYDTTLYGIRISDFNKWLEPKLIVAKKQFFIATALTESCEHDFVLVDSPVFMTKNDWGPCFTLVDATTTKDVTVQIFTKGIATDEPKIAASFVATLMKGSPKLTATKKIVDISVTENATGRAPSRLPFGQSFGAAIVLTALSGDVRRRVRGWLRRLKARYEGYVPLYRRFMRTWYAGLNSALAIGLMIISFLAILVLTQVRSYTSTITASTQSVVTYEITVGNEGTRSARNVKLVDEFSPEATYVDGSLAMDGVPLTPDVDGDAGFVSATSATAVWSRFPVATTHVFRIGLKFSGVLEGFSNGAELSSDEQPAAAFESTCGNGFKESKEYLINGVRTVVGEICDDGDRNGTPGNCSLDCKGLTPICGNGKYEPVFAMTPNGYRNVGEFCDDGVLNGSEFGYCRKDCLGTYIPADFICGNGEVDSYKDHKKGKEISEACDEGALNGTSGHCDKKCQSIIPLCGNGSLESGEFCDDGALNGEPGKCALGCKYVMWTCGNGVTEERFDEDNINFGEKCDDGADKNGKLYGYCAADCKGTYIPADFVCGNGAVNSYKDYKQDKEISEFCDDGDKNGKPGFCSKNCRSIIPACGNGKVEAAEKCDQGADNGQPGHCSKDCTHILGDCGNGVNEPYFVESKTGKVNVEEVCDDGDPDPTRPHLYKDEIVYAKDGKNGKLYGYCAADCKGTYIPADFVCGNGAVNSYKDYKQDKEISEFCDDGDKNGKPGFCSKNCRSIIPACGNGKVEAAEKCDQGADNGQPGHCSKDCTHILGDCGNGVNEPYFVEGKFGPVNVGETCDQGDSDPTKPHLYKDQTVFAKNGTNGIGYGYCKADCTGLDIPQTCGNFKVDGWTNLATGEKHVESCDNGSRSSKDAQGEPGNNGRAGYCNGTCDGFVPECGNGLKETGELCDEGTPKGIHRIGGVVVDTSGGKNGQSGHCSLDCKRIMEDCGNGAYEPFFVETNEGKVNVAESCDDGDPDSTQPHLLDGQTVYATDGKNGKLYGYCAADCKGTYIPTDFICGNGAVNSYRDYKLDRDVSESCDEGGLNGKSGHCARNCRGVLPLCGNGVVEGNEVCDSGPEADLDVGICKPDCSGYLDEAYLLLLKSKAKLSKRYVISLEPIVESASSTSLEDVNSSSSLDIIPADELPPDPKDPLEGLFAVVDDKLFRLYRDAFGNIILPPDLLKLSGKEFFVLKGRDLLLGENQTATDTTSVSPVTSSATVKPAAAVGGIYSALGRSLSAGYSILRSAISQPTADIGTALAAAVSLAGLAAAVGPSFWTLLLMFMTQPLQLLGHRKPGAYGLVLNSLTQLPEPFSIVRLKSSQDQKILQTRVTDRYGRYVFLAEAGAYVLDVTKKGFTYPTRLFRPGDKDAEDQVLLVDPHIDQVESGSIIKHVPIDPIEAAEKPRTLNHHRLMAALRTALAGFGPVVSLAMAVLRPSASTFSFVLVQALLFVFFWLVARPQLPRAFATVKDEVGKPLARAVVRLFSKRFNKLVDMQITDGSGHYAFLTGPGEYLLSVEKPGYGKVVVEVNKMPGEKTITAQDVGLTPQADDQPTGTPTT